MRKALLFVVLTILSAPAIAGNPRPDSGETPGVCRQDISVEKVCATKWGKDARFVTEKMKQDVLKAYGIPSHNGYEIDHLCPRDLGGADVIANLWPQPYFGTCRAQQKDRLEVKLRNLVCSGQLDPTKTKQEQLEIAQRMITTDWIEAYRDIFGQSCDGH